MHRIEPKGSTLISKHRAPHHHNKLSTLLLDSPKTKPCLIPKPVKLIYSFILIYPPLQSHSRPIEEIQQNLFSSAIQTKSQLAVHLKVIIIFQSSVEIMFHQVSIFIPYLPKFFTIFLNIKKNYIFISVF